MDRRDGTAHLVPLRNRTDEIGSAVFCQHPAGGFEQFGSNSHGRSGSRKGASGTRIAATAEPAVTLIYWRVWGRVSNGRASGCAGDGDAMPTPCPYRGTWTRDAGLHGNKKYGDHAEAYLWTGQNMESKSYTRMNLI